VQVRHPLPDAWLLLAGLLFLIGFAVSVVTGMLYKIVPFLAWFHLQARLGYKPASRACATTCRKRAHAASSASTWPPSPACWRTLPAWFAIPGGLLLAAAAALLGWNLLRLLTSLSTGVRGWLLGASRLIMASHRQVISQLSNSCT